MNWFQRHLNWTWVLSWVVLVWIIAPIVGVILNIDALDAGRITGRWGLFLIILPMSAWVLNCKGRSLTWLLLFWIASPLWLGNKKIGQQGEGDTS